MRQGAGASASCGAALPLTTTQRGPASASDNNALRHGWLSATRLAPSCWTLAPLLGVGMQTREAGLQGKARRRRVR